MNNEDFNSVKCKIGLEIHITPSSKRKIFNFNKNFSDQKLSSNNVEAWELGYLGTLPLLNSEVLELALKCCLVFNMKINRTITFDRKIYSYFDLSKGFQITQKFSPIGSGGYLPIFYNDQIINIPLESIHLEEDTAKSYYRNSDVMLDFNRSGNPLFELVTDPVFDNIDKVLEFIKQLQSLLVYLKISDAKMEKGQLRIDLNFSFRFGDKYITPRYEIKNLNSLKNLKNAFEFELEKHTDIYKNTRDDHLLLKSETLGFNESLQKTFVQREKSDYFYLPESNIPIINISEEEIFKLQEKIDPLPWDIWQKMDKNYPILIARMIFEKPRFLRMIASLFRNRINYENDFIMLAKFFLNFLSKFLEKFNEEDSNYLLEVKILFLWELFYNWKEKLISKEGVRSILNDLSTSDLRKLDLDKFKSLEEKNLLPLEQVRIEFYNAIKELNISRKIIQQPQKLSALLIGYLKKKFPQQIFDYDFIFELAMDISEKNSVI